MDKTAFLQYRSKEYRELRYWAYRKRESLELFTVPIPNTEEICFTFWKINHSTWELLEEECLELVHPNCHETVTAYNYEKMKLFFLRYFPFLEF